MGTNGKVGMETSPSDSGQSQDLASLAERLNESLRVSGASSAEQAFGLGCTIGLTPILVILLVLFIFKVINLILAFILLGLAILAMVGIAMLVAQQARQNGMKRAYRTGVEAEINQYLAQSSLTRPQFDFLVSKLLPEEAPLQAFLSLKEQA